MEGVVIWFIGLLLGMSFGFILGIVWLCDRGSDGNG